MKKGFTLIELLIVIGIIAVLSVVVLLTLNPAELLRQSRDSNRLSDLSTLKSALALYSTDVDSATQDFGDAAKCYTTLPSIGVPTAPALGAVLTGCGGRFIGVVIPSGANNFIVSATPRAVGGTGWLPVNLTSIGAGAPLSALPVDPVNRVNSLTAFVATSSYYYAYRPVNLVSGANDLTCTSAGTKCLLYEANANTESVKFSQNGTQDAESGDGGNHPEFFEAGSDQGLDL